MPNKKSEGYVVPFADEHLIEGFVDELGYLWECGIEFDDLVSTAVACSVHSAVKKTPFEESFQELSTVESYSYDTDENPGSIDDFYTPMGMKLPLCEVEERMCNAAKYIGDRLSPYMSAIAGSVKDDAEIESYTEKNRVLVSVREVDPIPEDDTYSAFVSRLRQQGHQDMTGLINEKIDEITKK